MGGDDQAVLTAVNSLHTKIDSSSTKTHERIDSLVDSVGKVQVSVGEMKVSLEVVKKDVNGHLNDHKQSGKNVLKGVMTTVFTMGGLVLAAWIIYEAGWR